MTKKRSKGVSFWGWIFIILSTITIIDFVAFGTQRVKEWGLFLFAFILISCQAYIICGILVLKLKEVGRKMVIILGILSILSTPLYLKPMVSQIGETCLTEVQKEMRRQPHDPSLQLTPEEQQKALALSCKIGSYLVNAFIGILVLILEIIPIWLFTRPKIKEQFIPAS